MVSYKPSGIYRLVSPVVGLIGTVGEIAIRYRVRSVSVSRHGNGYYHDESNPGMYHPGVIRTSEGIYTVGVRTDRFGRVVDVNNVNSVIFTVKDGLDFPIYQQSFGGGYRGEGGLVTVETFEVYDVQVVRGGSGYTVPPLIKAYSDSSLMQESSLKLTATVSGGVIQSVSFNSNCVLSSFPYVYIYHNNQVFSVPSGRAWRVFISPQQVSVQVSLRGNSMTMTAGLMRDIVLVQGDSFSFLFNGYMDVPGLRGVSLQDVVTVYIMEYNLGAVVNNALGISGLEYIPLL